MRPHRLKWCRWHGCRKKKRYQSLEDAEDAAWEAFMEGLGALHAYQCVFCNRFHIGGRFWDRKHPLDISSEIKRGRNHKQRYQPEDE